MDACMNKEQQVPEYQEATKAAMEHVKGKNVSIRHRNILSFRLIPCPNFPHMTWRKHCRMTRLIQVQDKNQPNQ